MKKVLIFYPYITAYGGIEENIITLAKKLHQRNTQLILLCFYDKLLINRYCKYIKVIKLGNQNYLLKIIRLRAFLKNYDKKFSGFALFITHKAAFFGAIINFKNYVLHLDDTLGLLSFKKEININFLRKFKRNIVHQIYNRGIKNAQIRVTTTNRNASEFFKDHGQKFKVINLGVNKIDYEEEEEERKKNILNLLSISRIEISKNIEWIIEGLRELLKITKIIKHFKKINLFIVGTGPDMDRLKKIVTKYKINKYVHFTGFVSNNKKKQLLSQSHFALIPAVQGYGIPVLESLIRKTPVIINKETRISEILKKNPWVKISENNKEDFINKMIDHIDKLHLKLPNESFLKKLPSQNEWSTKIFQYCEW
jgi:glycosyltransferase involved in cell wall biosynthesis